MKPFRDIPIQQKMLVMTLLICGFTSGGARSKRSLMGQIMTLLGARSIGLRVYVHIHPSRIALGIVRSISSVIAGVSISVKAASCHTRWTFRHWSTGRLFAHHDGSLPGNCFAVHFTCLFWMNNFTTRLRASDFGC